MSRVSFLGASEIVLLYNSEICALKVKSTSRTGRQATFPRRSTAGCSRASSTMHSGPAAETSGGKICEAHSAQVSLSKRQVKVSGLLEM